MGAEETPIGEWSVTRIRSAGHGTSRSISVLMGIGTNGLGEKGDSVPRQLVLTKTSLVERRQNNYEVSCCTCLLYSFALTCGRLAF